MPLVDQACGDRLHERSRTTDHAERLLRRCERDLGEQLAIDPTTEACPARGLAPRQRIKHLETVTAARQRLELVMENHIVQRTCGVDEPRRNGACLPGAVP